MSYDHKQTGPLFLLVFAIAALLILVTWFDDVPEPAKVIFAISAIPVVFVGFCFQSLTVSDGGSQLLVRFGPIPLFRTSVKYAEITNISVAKSSFVDGWGIHWVPGRGWTYNLWGFDCVELQVGKSVVRIGSDDAENLAAFLKQRIEEDSGLAAV